MKRYSTIMSVLLTLALPIAGNGADAPKPADKADASVEAIKADMAKSKDSMGMGGASAAAAGSTDTSPNGKVVETMDGGGYTYAQLEKDGKKTWVAYTTRETHVGENLAFRSCLLMSDFQSTALKRKFEEILFCDPPAKPSVAAKSVTGKKSPGSGGAAAAAGKIKVEKAEGANAYTVAEIFAKRGSLNGKQVVVKGKVVKVASGIMNRTWIHLQDGSGSDKQKNHDLVVTSTESAEIGDVVTVSGTLAKDKDFGSGYKYDVIIEKGSVKK
jgi:hypothetical protein